MWIVASCTTECPCALAVAPRPRKPDRLEPGQEWVAATDLLGARSIGMTMAVAAEAQELRSSPSAGAKGEGQLGWWNPAAGRRDVCPSRTMAPLTGDVGNHRPFINLLTPLGGDLGCMTAEARASGAGGRNAAVGREPGRRRFYLVTGSETQRA
jgi:hypothetical protein